MSSPFAQKFMGKRPFSDEQYENLAKKYAKKEKEQSVENDAPDYETRMRLQEELAKELEQKKQEGSSSPNQMSPLNRYVSIEPAMQRLQRDAENIAAMDQYGKESSDIEADEKFMKSGPGKDMSEKAVEKRIFGKKKKAKKPIDIQDIDIYEIEDGF